MFRFYGLRWNNMKKKGRKCPLFIDPIYVKATLIYLSIGLISLDSNY